MTKLYYKKNKQHFRIILRYFGLGLFLSGILFSLYFFFPLVSWQLYMLNNASMARLAIPIPKNSVLNGSTMESLFSTTVNAIRGIDYTNAQNWFPNFQQNPKAPRIQSYELAIPKIHITQANVSTADYNLANHLVNYLGTAVPPEKGNAVIFGHSTLPGLFNPNDYKTIFANAHTLKIGDTIIVSVDKVLYTYKIFRMTVVDPEDTSALIQDIDDSYITLVTCTPPGTVWKRLIIKARLEKLA